MTALEARNKLNEKLNIPQIDEQINAAIDRLESHCIFSFPETKSREALKKFFLLNGFKVTEAQNTPVDDAPLVYLLQIEW